MGISSSPSAVAAPPAAGNGAGWLPQVAERRRQLPAWRSLVEIAGLSRLALSLLLGITVAQARLTLAPDAGVGPALGGGLRALLGAWVILTLVHVALDLAHGRTKTESLVGPWPITLAGMALIAAALQRAPARLVVNLLGYGLLALPFLWIVQARAGRVTAARAAAALAIFALVPTNVDLPRPPPLEPIREDSPFRWTVGWPAEEWSLRHEIHLPAPAPPRPQVLVVPLAARYDGPARIVATLNGQDLGAARFVDNGGTVKIDLPPGLVAGQMRLVFELRQRPFDRSLRITAHRWANGASAGPNASSYFDGERWWPGTFNDVLGRHQHGVYFLRLEDAS